MEETTALIAKGINADDTHNPDQQDHDLSFLTIFKDMSKISIPMAFSYTFSFQMVLLVNLLSHISDDDDQLASITLITALLNTLVIVGISPLFAMSLTAGNEIGALKKAESEKKETSEQLTQRRSAISAVLRNGLLISAPITVPVVLGMVYAEPLLTNIFRQNEHVSRLTQDFVRPYSITIPAMMLRVCSEQIMFAFGKTTPSMVIGLANFLITMGAGTVFSLGLFGAPAYGVDAILTACIVECYLTALAFSVYIAKHKEFKDFDFFKLNRPFKPYLSQLREIANIGKSFAFSMGTEMALMLGTGVLAGLVGVKEQAALSEAMQYTLLTSLYQAAFGMATAQEMSRKIGEHRFREASSYGKYGLVTTIFYVAPIPIILAIDPKLLSQMLGQDNADIDSILKILLPLISTATILDASRFGLLQQLRVLGDANVSSFISSGCLASGMVISTALGLKTELGIYGVGAGYVIGELCANLALALRWVPRKQHAQIKASTEPTNSNSETCMGGILRKVSIFAENTRHGYQAIPDAANKPAGP